ncbi:MAG: hypothetical protein QW156_03975 [Candidatus Aenigmatarchaeota archaeon]
MEVNIPIFETIRQFFWHIVDLPLAWRRIDDRDGVERYAQYHNGILYWVIFYSQEMMLGMETPNSDRDEWVAYNDPNDIRLIREQIQESF